jgi:hypothetical protein
MRRFFASAFVVAVAAGFTQAADDDKWVSISGRITWNKANGPAPVQKAINATKDQQVAAKDKEFLTEDYVVSAKTGGIKNVVVWLAPEPTAEQLAGLKSRKIKDFPSFKSADIHPAIAKPAKPAVEIDQPCCRFIPHIVLAREGQDLIINNSAPVPHNAKFESVKSGAVNPLLPAGGSHTIKNLQAEKGPIELSCNIHPWMKAWIRVFDHPYYALTDVDGNFEIKNVPVLGGKLRLFLWQESGGFQNGAEGRLGQTISVKAGKVDLNTIDYSPAK